MTAVSSTTMTAMTTFVCRLGGVLYLGIVVILIGMAGHDHLLGSFRTGQAKSRLMIMSEPPPTAAAAFTASKAPGAGECSVPARCPVIARPRRRP
jgi:hypothetical protein